jgi:hypothetical protein
MAISLAVLMITRSAIGPPWSRQQHPSGGRERHVMGGHDEARAGSGVDFNILLQLFQEIVSTATSCAATAVDELR